MPGGFSLADAQERYRLDYEGMCNRGLRSTGMVQRVVYEALRSMAEER